MSISQSQIEACARAHAHNPDTTPSAEEVQEFVDLTKKIAESSGAHYFYPPTDLGEAIRLAERPILLAAYRCAKGSRSQTEAEAVGEVYHIAANGSSMPASQIRRYLDLLIPAYEAAGNQERE